MPADAAAIHATIERYLATFSADDREGWLALWADDCTMEDPVGSPLKHGREEVGAFYDFGHGLAESIELRPLGVAVVVGNEAAFAFEARSTVGGEQMALSVIDVMTFDDDARITSQRAFQDFGQLHPVH